MRQNDAKKLRAPLQSDAKYFCDFNRTIVKRRNYLQ